MGRRRRSSSRPSKTPVGGVVSPSGSAAPTTQASGGWSGDGDLARLADENPLGCDTIATGGDPIGASEAGIDQADQDRQLHARCRRRRFAGISEGIRSTRRRWPAARPHVPGGRRRGDRGDGAVAGRGRSSGAYLGAIFLNVLRDGLTIEGISANTYNDHPRRRDHSLHHAQRRREPPPPAIEEDVNLRSPATRPSLRSPPRRPRWRRSLRGAPSSRRRLCTALRRSHRSLSLAHSLARVQVVP